MAQQPSGDSASVLSDESSGSSDESIENEEFPVILEDDSNTTGYYLFYITGYYFF